MQRAQRVIGSLIVLLVAGCGSLEKKSTLIGPGDDKEKVLSLMVFLTIVSLV